jgi:acetolactate synthase-1/2/3 large subunit
LETENWKREDSSMIKLCDYVIDTVARLGLKHVFLLPGGGCMHLVDALGRNKELTPVGCLHEQAAIIAADGYAQYRNRIGVALVTTGPGSTNAITGVAAAWIDSTPLLVISGQAKRQDLLTSRGVRQFGIQEVDITSLVKPITKYAQTVMEPENIRYHLEKALYLAQSGRPGPVWIDVPLDVQGAMIDEATLPGFIPDGALPGTTPELSHAVDAALELLHQAERPVILAGRGIRLADAEEEFQALIERLKIPVLTTWRMADALHEDSEHYFGRPGAIASRYANFIQQNADCLLILGARLDLPQVGHSYEHFAPYAQKIMVDIDAAEIKKVETKIAVPIVADAKDFLNGLLKRLGSDLAPGRASWRAQCQKWKSKYPVVLPEYLQPARVINTYALIEALGELLREDDVLVPGSSGSCAEITCQAFKMKKGQRLINSPGLGSMGFGLPQSMGVCLASNRRTVCIVGDGGLQHNIQELETIRRLQLPLKIFVLNNNAYASIRNTHRRFFEGRLVCCDPTSGLTLPDTCRVAAAYGLQTRRISEGKHLTAEVRQVLEHAGPVVCEVMIDPDLQTAPRLSSAARPDGTMESKPLEDLWPFLEREEFAANMLASGLRKK